MNNNNNEIFEKLVKISEIEKKPAQIHTKIQTSKMAIKIYKKAMMKFSKEWSKDIIESEFVASMYCAIQKTNEKFNSKYIEDNIEDFENNEVKKYMKYLEKTALNMMIANLMPANNTKQHHGHKTYLYIDTKPTNNIDFVVDLYQTETETEEENNFFWKWFSVNKYDILTKKQIKYLQNVPEYTPKMQYKYTQNIAKRIIEKFQEKYNTKNIKEIEKQEKIEIIEDILDNPTKENIVQKSNKYDFIEKIVEMSKEDRETAMEITAMYVENKNISKKIMYKIMKNMIKALETIQK